MVERVKGWKVGDEVFASRKDAERHEAREALIGRLTDWLATAERSWSDLIAQHIVEQIEADPIAFRDLIRPLVPLRTRVLDRKAKEPPAEKPARKPKAEAA